MSFKKAYDKLRLLIKERQDFEANHPYPPYSLYSTDINFFDIHGHNCLHYATMMDDKEAVLSCLEEGAHINLVHPLAEQTSPLSLALENGHLDMAEFLFSKGADCKNIYSFNFKKEESKQWILDHIKKDLEQKSFHRRFCHYKRTKFSLALEAGDKRYFDSLTENGTSLTKFLKKFIDSNNSQTISPTEVAISSGQLEIIKLALDNGVILEPSEPYTHSAIFQAVASKSHTVLDYLLEKKWDVNKQNHFKHTALMVAIAHEDFNAVEKLIKAHADITLKNIDGQTVFHYCKNLKDLRIIQLLLKQPHADELLNNEDIYGMKPLDLAIQARNDALILTFEPTIDPEKIDKLPGYGIEPIDLSEGWLSRIYFYLKTQYRSTELFSSEGYCNGMSYYRQLRSKAELFFKTLELIASWNGDNNDLETPFLAIAPQRPWYNNLKEVFEQWLNDITWFQQVEGIIKNPLEQTNRRFQNQVIGLSDDRDITLFSMPYDIFSPKFSLEQIREIFNYASQMPIGIRMEIQNNAHMCGYLKLEDGTHSYFDPNFLRKTTPTITVDSYFERMIDYLYIAQKQFQPESLNFGFRLFCFEQDALDFENFNILTACGLPTSKEERLAFQQNSPNRFTPLHVAVLTNSVEAVKILLAEKDNDLDEVDINGLTPLAMAIRHGSVKTIKLLLNSTSNRPNLESYIKFAYNEERKDIVPILADCSEITSLACILNSAIKNNDLDSLKSMVLNKKVALNENNGAPLALTTAFTYKSDVGIVEFLLEEGSSLFMIDEFNFHKTPLEVLIDYKPSLLKSCLPYLCPIDKKDEKGNSALHYAALYLDVKNIKMLLENGANPTIRNHDHVNPLMAVMDHNKSSYKNQLDCVELLLESTTFDLSNKADRNCLSEIINFYFIESSTEFQNKLLEKCDKIVLDSLNIKKMSILHQAILKDNPEAVKKLLEAGATVDLPTGQGSTPPVYDLISKFPSSHYPNKYQIIELLIDFKANLSFVNENGKTVLDLVSASSDEKLVDIFTKRGLLEGKENCLSF